MSHTCNPHNSSESRSQNSYIWIQCLGCLAISQGHCQGKELLFLGQLGTPGQPSTLPAPSFLLILHCFRSICQALDHFMSEIQVRGEFTEGVHPKRFGTLTFTSCQGVGQSTALGSLGPAGELLCIGLLPQQQRCRARCSNC